MLKYTYICPFCAKELPLAIGILQHCIEEHDKIFDRYPNPLVPKENIIIRVVEEEENE